MELLLQHVECVEKKGKVPWNQLSRSPKASVMQDGVTHMEFTQSLLAQRGSEEEGFLLQLIPLPQGQLAELLWWHLKDTQEILRRKVSLRKRSNKWVLSCKSSADSFKH